MRSTAATRHHTRVAARHIAVEVVTRMPRQREARQTVGVGGKPVAHRNGLEAHRNGPVAHHNGLVVHHTELVAHHTELVAHHHTGLVARHTGLVGHHHTGLVAHHTGLGAHHNAQAAHRTEAVGREHRSRGAAVPGQRPQRRGLAQPQQIQVARRKWWVRLRLYSHSNPPRA